MLDYAQTWKPPNSRHQQDLVLSVPQFLYHPPVFKASSSNLPILGVPVIETSNFPKLHSSRINSQHEQRSNHSEMFRCPKATQTLEYLITNVLKKKSKTNFPDRILCVYECRHETGLARSLQRWQRPPEGRHHGPGVLSETNI